MPSNHLTPRQIVEKLDQYIIGQGDAKRAVAIALRNRWRRQNVAKELARRSLREHYHDRTPPALARPKLPEDWQNWTILLF